MLKGIYYSFQLCIAVLVIIGFCILSVEADLSDPTISVYYSFDGKGETVTDGSANGMMEKLWVVKVEKRVSLAWQLPWKLTHG